MGAEPAEQAKMPSSKTNALPHLKTLGHDDYLALRADAVVVEGDRYGEKVLRLADGNYLKLFRRKRLISSAVWYPYAQRFADNAAALSLKGIPCPQVIGVYRIREISRDAVHYHPLAGETLRQLIRNNAALQGIPEKLGRFVAHLHDNGIYFRSLHLQNIVLTPSEDLGLIDIADLRFVRHPLTKGQRQRNLERLYRDPEDKTWLKENIDFFEKAYGNSTSARIQPELANLDNIFPKRQ